MRAATVAILLISIALVAGCVGQVPTGGAADIAIRAVADPPQIRPGESMSLFIDVENTGKLDLKNVVVDVFDTGMMVITEPKPGACIATIPELRPGQIESVECRLTFVKPETLIQPFTPNQLTFRTTFEKSISSTIVVDMLSLDELRRLERIGRIERKPQSYTFGDGQLQAALQFQRQPPFVAGDTVIAQLSVRNVGPGYVGTLDPRNFIINQSDASGRTFSCAFDAPLYSTNGVFPPITCILTVPQELPTAAAYPITLVLGYGYEIRQSLSVSIAKP